MKKFGLRAQLCALFLAFMLAGFVTRGMAAPGDVITNGTNTPDDFGVTGLVVPGFLFEPEVPLASLKTVPIFDELEQLLDNPYQVQTCSSLPAAVDALVRNTPGTTQITGSPIVPLYPSYCSSSTLVRRRSYGGITLPPLLVHPLNYNPTDGEEMRLLNPQYLGGRWIVPDQLVQPLPALNLFAWRYRRINVTPGADRVGEAEIDYNGPLRTDADLTAAFNAAAAGSTNTSLALATAFLNVPILGGTCVTNLEASPPEGALLCGGDPGEPGYAGFGVLLPTLLNLRRTQYSLPAVPLTAANTTTVIPSSARLFDNFRGSIQPRNTTTGAGGLRKPSVRVPPYGTPASPGYLANSNPADETVPSNENDYVKDKALAAVMGKSLFWDMQVGSDAVQSCGSCHAHAAADNRVKNQINPNDIGGDVQFEVRQPNEELTVSDFPFNHYNDPEIAGDPKCVPAIKASVNPGVLENNPGGVTNRTVCDAANVIPDKNNRNGEPGFAANDVASSMGVHFGRFNDIPPIGTFTTNAAGVQSVTPDLRSPNAADNVDPIPGYQGSDGSGHGIRRVEPRNTPTIIAAAINFDNFWDGRARHDFNGGSVFGSADPQSHVFVGGVSGDLTPTRQLIRFVSIASLATGPGLSQFEMSLNGRNWAKIAKKLLQAGTTPLANQLVDPTDSVIGPYSNQGGSACASVAVGDRSPGSPAAGKPGLCISYPGLIRNAFYPALHQSTGAHLVGCYSDGAAFHPNQCAPGVVDPFDGYVLTPASGAADPTDTNQFTQMEGNFSLFWGLSIHKWATLLMADNTPYDQFLDKNPDMFESIGEVGEAGLVGPLPVCSGVNAATQRHCFREVGNFKRDSSFSDPTANLCQFPASGEGSTTLVPVSPCKGTRNPASNAPDPLLGMDIFQGSNLSLKNPNFRAARCGECHAGATLTDNTVPFTTKAQLGDFIGEFLSRGNEALIEPLGRTRVISGFLLESELGENGQDAVERRMINQSIVPNAEDGLAYPDGLFTGDHTGAGQSLFDNGVYNLGVTRCEADQTHVTGVCDDNGRGNTDAFGWPMSLATLMLKNVGGHNGGDPCTDSANCNTEPGVALANFDPDLGAGGGLFEETAQDQQINPGEDDDLEENLLPPYLGPFANRISVGDSQPELDEIHAGLNVLTDVAMLEGFIDTLGPFNPAGLLNESMNMGEGPEMGTYPIPNRVGRFGSMKAPQLREVELTGPYFHSGAVLTLRQVVDFYVRGGNYPVTNAEHRDFNIVNLNLEVESNLKESEKVALVDFLLELTDDRVRYEKAPFDHPQVILPLDGTAPENTTGRDAMLGQGQALADDCTLSNGGTPSPLGPGLRVCAGGKFLDVPASGAAGIASPIPNFLGIAGRQPGLNGQPIKRLSGAAANCTPIDSQYCH